MAILLTISSSFYWVTEITYGVTFMPLKLDSNKVFDQAKLPFFLFPDTLGPGIPVTDLAVKNYV